MCSWRPCAGLSHQVPPKQSAVCSTCIIPAPSAWVPPNLSWGNSRPYAVLQRTLEKDCRQAEELNIYNILTFLALFTIWATCISFRDSLSLKQDNCNVRLQCLTAHAVTVYRLARHVQQWFSREYVWWSGSKPSCQTVRLVTTVWSTTSHCDVMSTSVMSHHDMSRHEPRKCLQRHENQSLIDTGQRSAWTTFDAAQHSLTSH